MRQMRLRGLDLAPGAGHVGSQHDDRRRPAVVADGNGQPVWRQRIRGAAEHTPLVLRKVTVGIEIRVFGNLERHPHLHV
jgi:hypothetical protein